MSVMHAIIKKNNAIVTCYLEGGRWKKLHADNFQGHFFL